VEKQLKESTRCVEGRGEELVAFTPGHSQAQKKVHVNRSREIKEPPRWLTRVKEGGIVGVERVHPGKVGHEG